LKKMRQTHIVPIRKAKATPLLVFYTAAVIDNDIIMCVSTDTSVQTPCLLLPVMHLPALKCYAQKSLFWLMLVSCRCQSCSWPVAKVAITSKVKHSIKHKTSPARLAQLLQPSLAFCFSLQPMTAYRALYHEVIGWLLAKTKC